MTNAENMDGVLRRVQKLLAIAGDDRANPEEASAAADMAERIMRKFQIEQSDVIIAALKAGDDMGAADCLAQAAGCWGKAVKVALWAQWIGVRVAKLNDCKITIGKRAEDGQACVRFQGFKSDVQVAAWTFNYLIATTNRLCQAFRATPQFRTGGRVAANGYRKGVAHGIMATLVKMIEAKTAEMSTGNGRALVVAKAQAVAEKFGLQAFRKTKTVAVDAQAFARGREDGRNVDVARRAIGAERGEGQLRLAA